MKRRKKRGPLSPNGTRVMLGLIVVVAALAGCATQQPQPMRNVWLLTIRTVTGPYDTEAACAAAARSARATIEAQPAQAGKPWTFVCDPQGR
jgi:hypothetical protein